MANEGFIVPVFSLEQAVEHCLRVQAKQAEEKSAVPDAVTVSQEPAQEPERPSLIVHSQAELNRVGRYFIDRCVIGVTYSTIFANGQHDTFYQMFFDCSIERAAEVLEELNAKDNAPDAADSAAPGKV